jgi:hypothetical protein
MNIIAASPVIMDNRQLTSLPLPDLNLSTPGYTEEVSLEKFS